MSFRKGLSVTRSPRTAPARTGAACLALAGSAVLLPACSPSGSPSPSVVRAPARTAPAPTTPTRTGRGTRPAGPVPSSDPSPPCREGAFALHLSLVRGTFDTYLREPFETGGLAGTRGVPARAAGVRAGHFVERQLAAAATSIGSCRGHEDLLRATALGTRAVGAAVVLLRAGRVSPSALAAASRAVDDLAEAARAARLPVVPELPGPPTW